MGGKGAPGGSLAIAGRGGRRRRTAGRAAIQALIAGIRAQLLRRQHAEAIGEILLLRVDLLAQLLDLMGQFLVGAGGVDKALGEAPAPGLPAAGCGPPSWLI